MGTGEKSPGSCPNGQAPDEIPMLADSGETLETPPFWRPPAEHWQAPALETPIPHGFGGPGPGSPEQILAAVGRRSFRFTDRWSASSYQTDRISGLRSCR